MPEKPENEKMDELLKAYARKRRGHPEVEMHPATRRMLQGEVKRIYGAGAEKREGAAGGWLRKYWPYLAVSAVLAFILADLVMAPRRLNNEMSLAQNESEKAGEEFYRQPEASREEGTLSGDKLADQDLRVALREPAPKPVSKPAPKEQVLVSAAPAPSASPEVVEAQPLAQSRTERAVEQAAPVSESKVRPVLAESQPAAGVTEPPNRVYFQEQSNMLASAKDTPAEPAGSRGEVVLLMAPPPLQSTDSVEAAPFVPNYRFIRDTNEVRVIELTNLMAEAEPTGQSNAQELVQKAWEARMLALAPNSSETLRRAQSTSAAPSGATSTVAKAPAQELAKPAEPAPPPAAAVPALKAEGVQVQETPALTGTSNALSEQEVQMASAASRTLPRAARDTAGPSPEAGRERFESAAGVAGDVPPAGRVDPAPRLAGLAALTNLGAAQRTWFLQTTNGTENVSPDLLPRFKVERLGEELRFLDEDGSVYLGKISKEGILPRFEPVSGRPLGEFDGVPQRSRFAPMPAVPTDVVITNSVVYDFAVEGTNLTLGLPVTVRGKYVERTNSPSIRGISGVAAGPAVAERANVPRIPKTKAAIVGAAVIGGTNTVEFKALAPE